MIKNKVNRINIGFTFLFLFLNMLQGLNVTVPRGSGVIIKENQILTANHLVGIGKEHTIGIDGRNVAGKIIKRNRMRDLALIEIVGKYQHVKKLRLNPRLGDKVYVPCNVGGEFEDVVFTGRIAKIEKNEIIIQTTIIPGMSGAGVFDKAGSLIGIVSKMYGSEDNGDWMMILVPAWQIKEFMED